MIVPDYRGGSIVNLMISIMQAFDADDPQYPPLRELPRTSLASRNVVLLVVDGLGYDNLLAYGGNGQLARRLVARMTSVFPSTTGTAITTFLTGTAPQQHGVTGWFTYFRELGTVLAVLPHRARNGGVPVVSPAALLGHVPIFDKLRANCHVVAPERIVHSPYNAAHNGKAQAHGFATLRDMLDCIGRVVRNDGRNYVYAYWPELDRLAHEHGVASEPAVAHLAELDAAFGELTAALEGTDTTLIVTADHGFVDSRPEQAVELEHHPGLADALVVPLCGERRVAYCYVRAGRVSQFVDYVGVRLGELAELWSSERLIESGYFGLGAPHPRLHERVGDYTLIMKDRAVIKDWLPGETRYVHVGVHGGLSAAEMYVPLIVVRA